MRLGTRVALIERKAGGRVCPVCGCGPGVPVEYCISEQSAPYGSPPVIARCAGCNRVTEFTIAFDRRDATEHEQFDVGTGER